MNKLIWQRWKTGRVRQLPADIADDGTGAAGITGRADDFFL